MKKLLFISLMVLSYLNCTSQSRTRHNRATKQSHELKFNLLYLVANVSELSYEFNQHKPNASIGVSLLFVHLEEDYLNSVVTLYYKKYLGAKKCYGFYFEGHSAIVNGMLYDDELSTGLGLGLAIGGKFIRNNRWVVDTYLGLGSMLRETQSDFLATYPRMGVNFGYRL